MKYHHKSLALSVFVALAVLVLSTPPSSADIPKIISYQGKVTDTGGNPIPDGTYDMQFSIWNQESGGFAPLWMSGMHNVDVTDGIFSVLLGTVGTSPLDLEFNVDLWLDVTIEGDTQTPRQRLGSVGYAFMASGLVHHHGGRLQLTHPDFEILAGGRDGTNPGLHTGRMVPVYRLTAGVGQHWLRSLVHQALELLQQCDLLRIRQARQWITRRIQRTHLAGPHQPGFTGAALTRDGARRSGRGLKRIQADIVGISKGGLFATDGTHANAQLNVEAANLYDAILQTPAFTAAVLKDRSA